MDYKASGSFFAAPSAEPDQLEDLCPLLRRVVGALLGRLSLALRAVDGEFAFEQHGVGVSMITLGEQADHGHRVLERPRSGGEIAAHKED